MYLQDKATKILQENIQKSFSKYLWISKDIDKWILHKTRHTYWVLEEGQNIFLYDEYLKSLPKSTIELCETSAILHDIARFYQINTEKKRIATNSEFEHWNIWYEILKKTFFVDFPEVLLAVKYHNKISHTFLYDDNLYKSLSKQKQEITEICLKYTRDADKLQNLKYSLSNISHFISLDVLSFSKWWLSKTVIETYKKETLINYADINTKADYVLLILAQQYDINFEWTKKILKSINFKNKMLWILKDNLWVDQDIINQL